MAILIFNPTHLFSAMVYRDFLSRRLAALVAVIALSSVSSWALPDFFKKDTSRVPATNELRRQEDIARAELDRATELENRGRSSKALDLHRNVVRKYPLTTAAAMSQFRMGEIYQSEGKHTKAFDAYQSLIDNYKSSSAFKQAISAQYAIAQSGQSGQFKQKVFAMVPIKTQPSELLEWYGKIIANAPYAPEAPLSQFAIAEIYQEKEETANAINAYQAFVDKYPGHAKSAEAQYRIGSIGKSAVASGSQDRGTVRDARGAMEDVLVRYQDSDRAAEARAAIGEFDMLEAEKKYNVAKFYEKQKKYRSAVVYYRKVAAASGSPHSADAQARIDAILSKAPEAAEVAQAPPRRTGLIGRNSGGTATPTIAGAPRTPTAAGNVAAAAGERPKLLKARKTYNGPPAPDLVALNTKPKMRTNPAAVPIVPPPPEPTPNPSDIPLPPPPDPDPEPAAGIGAALTPESTEPPVLPPDPDDDFLKLPPPPEPEPTLPTGS